MRVEDQHLSSLREHGCAFLQVKKPLNLAYGDDQTPIPFHPFALPDEKKSVKTRAPA